jgi:hypothetical protein
LEGEEKVARGGKSDLQYINSIIVYAFLAFSTSANDPPQNLNIASSLTKYCAAMEVKPATIPNQ